MLNCQVVNNSTAIRVLSHDPENQTLYVIFDSGKGYQYPDVNSEDFDKLRHSPSVGTEFNRSYRRGKEYEVIPSSQVSEILIKVLSKVPNDLISL